MFVVNSLVHILMGLPLVIGAAVVFGWRFLEVFLMLSAMAGAGSVIFAVQYWLYAARVKPKRS